MVNNKSNFSCEDEQSVSEFCFISSKSHLVKTCQIYHLCSTDICVIKIIVSRRLKTSGVDFKKDSLATNKLCNKFNCFSFHKEGRMLRAKYNALYWVN